MDVIFPKLGLHLYFPKGDSVIAVENPTAETDAKKEYGELRLAIKELMRW